jgi:hypothetical protein
MNVTNLCVAAAIAALCALPASAQQMKTVNGLVINLGLMSAEKAVLAEGHRDAHPDKFPSGSQHILIALADEKTRRPIGNADVIVEVIDPKGHATRKPLLHTSAAGMPDYSELFVFPDGGKYTLRVSVTPSGAAKAVTTSFVINHVPQ